jgi:uncharacterized protein (UPF0305 family)
MMRIRAVRLEVNTVDGLYGADYKFAPGLNIVRGDNSTGKSSLFQSILYALGFEELLGGRNDKTMQSVLKDQVEYPRDSPHAITQSTVYLEIENTEIITIRRSVKSPTRKSQLIDVYSGALLTTSIKEVPSRQMWVHDPGAASDETYGFHAFLADFLKIQLPEVVTAKGDIHKLYLQQLAPSFIIEQKAGWSDFFATIPYFGMRQTEQRVIEYLLELDVFENEKRKQLLNSEKQNLNFRWASLVDKFHALSERVGGKMQGLELSPTILNNFDEIYVSAWHNNNWIPLTELNDILKNQYAALENTQTTTVGGNIQRNEKELNDITDRLNQLTLNYEMLSPELNFDREKLKQYQKQLSALREDLRKNKGALKVTKLGGDLPTEIAKNICPTCEQDVKDSLLPSDIEQVPMRIEDNITYLDSQEKMIMVYIEGQQNLLKEKEAKLFWYQVTSKNLRQRIREIKRELVQDERLPSAMDIEKKVDLKRKIEFFNKTLDSVGNLLHDLKGLSKEYERFINKETLLPKDFFSEEDKSKLRALKDYFIELLRKFNYQSKPFDAIQISNDTYFPVAQKMDEALFYNIKFDSSASDFIRCIWAYTTALLKTSIKFDANHPQLLMLDEPKQQDLSKESFRNLLKELSEFKEQQVLLFASFENSDVSFQEATEGLTFSLNRIDKLLVAPQN